MNPSLGEQVNVPLADRYDTLPLPPLAVESGKKFELVNKIRKIGQLAFNRSFRRISFHGFDSVDEVFEFPELQKLSLDETKTMRGQLAQALANRQGYNPDMVDEDEPLRLGMSPDKLAISTTANLLKELQLIFRHNKRDKKIAGALYKETASRVIRKVLDTPNVRLSQQNNELNQSSIEGNRLWQEELDPRSVKALRKAIVSLAIGQGGNEQKELSTIRATGIYHIHSPLIAAYLGISNAAWEQQLEGKKIIVLPSVVDKLNFLLRLDVETASIKEITSDGLLGDSALDLLIPAQTDNSGQNVGEAFVSARLKRYIQALSRGRYKSRKIENNAAASSYRKRLQSSSEVRK